jgi:hypothetical protein
MNSEIDLKDVERRAYLSYFKDGIADLIAGLPILAFGLGMTFDSSTLMMLFWPLKHVITRPRFGYVIFSPERRRKISAGMVIMLIAGVFSLLLGVLAFLATQGQILNAREFMLEYSLLMFGVIMAGAFALVALVFQINRFFLHAIFIFAGWVSVIGLGLLARFIAQYPTVAE